MSVVDETEPKGCLSPLWSPLRSILGRDENPLPQYDDFYGYHSFESTLEHYTPGTILHSRSIRIKSFIGLKGSTMQAWQIAYVTAGPLGSETTVCTVIIPPNADQRDRLVIQCPKTDSANSNCRTSWLLRKGNGGPMDAVSEQIFMAPFLDRGYVVVVPDYEGQKDSFGCGIIAGRATLDAIRASLSFSDLNLAPRDKLRVVCWGYSGGAIASSWAAKLLESYAPELKNVMVGFSMGGLPVDLYASAVHLNASISAGLIVGLFQGLANAYPALQSWLDVNLTKEGREAFQLAKTKTFNSVMLNLINRDILNLVATDSNFLERHAKLFSMDSNPLLDPVPLQIMQENSLLYDFTQTGDERLIPKVPLYIYAGIRDNIVPIQTVDTLVETWRKHGASIDYVKAKLWQHVGLLYANHSEAVEWISDRLEGKELKKTTSIARQVEINIADEDSKTSLKNNRAEQLNDLYQKLYERAEQLWF